MAIINRNGGSNAAICHINNKVMIFDGTIVVTGSFNFTKAAEEKNAENLLTIRNKKMSEIYMGQLGEAQIHSENYEKISLIPRHNHCS
ncbi:MAG: phospholipase D-like domain-containing protein [Anaerolineaceae bacterium]|nr:phospholipase D-like domain-containing protein [Anaerolineaceae bacterium]